MFLRALVALALLQATPPVTEQTPAVDPTTILVLRLEEAAAGADQDGIRALAVNADVPGLDGFVSMTSPAPTSFIIKERDRVALPLGGERLMLEVFAEYGREAVITTWRADVIEAASEHRLAGLERLTIVTGLHRLTLDAGTQFEVRNLVLKGVDLTIELPSGVGYLASTADGPTAAVLIGRGRMRFSPSDPAERTQVRLFSGDPVLTSDFDAVFVRARPSDFRQLFGTSLAEVPVVPARLRRAQEVFDEFLGLTYHVDLADLSRDRWSLIPGPGDLVVEVRTRRMGNLTYTRSSRDPEDISLFDRRRRRNISVYASPEKLASRGPFYSEDDLTDYDVLHYDLSATFTPDRLWIEGTARITLRVRAFALASLSLRLADSLVVRGVVSPSFGRLFHLRVVGQNSVIVNLPATVPQNEELVLVVAYGGRLEPQRVDQESLAAAGQRGQIVQQEIYIPLEPQWLYSNRSYWYPQAMVTDFATAALQLAVPADYDVVATGTAGGPPATIPAEPGGGGGKLFSFTADLPSRYLAVAISRFSHIASREIAVPPPPVQLTASPHAAARPTVHGPAGDGSPRADGEGDVVSRRQSTVALSVQSNPRQSGRAREMTDRIAEIIEFYAGIVGDAPYPDFTLAVTENELPGGHSPAYFALLNEPSPLTPLVWRNDPVAFGYQPFFVAHEIAHQWWGQAVGWKNYHEQWLSEGFAQYFALMYAARDRGPSQQQSMLRQMRRTAIQQSPQGPVYLGYRLGHVRADGRVFRALVYNKGAMVLHMLRRLMGEEAFMAGVRQFYREWKFRKAGTDDLRAAMERVSGMELSAFFGGWIYGSAIPELRFRSEVRGSTAILRFEHQGAVIPTPVTVTLNYVNGETEEIVVPVIDRRVERTVALSGPLRSVQANEDHGALAEIRR